MPYEFSMQNTQHINADSKELAYKLTTAKDADAIDDGQINKVYLRKLRALCNGYESVHGVVHAVCVCVVFNIMPSGA